MSNLFIYSDNAIEASWFKNLHPIFEDVESRLILSRGQNVPLVENLIKYDRPDIILTDGQKALLVIEKTREVPTGHNVGQRVARLVKAVENRIPTIKFFPFDAKKHGEYASMCNLNIRLLLGFNKMWDIHDTPIIALNWKSDVNGELIDDGSEDDEIKKVMEAFVDSSFDRNCPVFNLVRENSQKEYKQRLSAHRPYGKPPPSVSFIPTEDYLKNIKDILNTTEINQLRRHQDSVVYKIKMSESKCRREDPYTGTQFIYDYAYCRNGILPNQKHKNLILHFPDIRKKVWLNNNPNDSNRKSCNWYLVANALIFSDGALVLR
jgi:hypothetical protein